MSNYTQTTNFTAKDALPSGDANKIIYGADLDTEYSALAVTSATKANKISSAITNDMILQNSSGDLVAAGWALPNVNADITASDEELNFSVGVTSSIQTQLDSISGVSGAALTAANNLSDVANAITSRTNLGLAIGTNVQAYNTNLTNIASLAVTNNNFIVGNGVGWVAESGSTARTSLGLGNMAVQNSGAVAISGGVISGIQSLAIIDGGTGANTASSARTNLGLGSLAVLNGVTQSEIGTNSVGQSELKATSANQSISIFGYGTGALTLTGGSNTLNWILSNANDATIPTMYIVNTGQSTIDYTSNLGIYNSLVNARTAYVFSRYLQASPPYKLDDIVPLFIYLLIDNSNKEILGSSIALDPAWAYHGHTNIAAKWFDSQGRAWRKEKQWRVDLFNGEGVNPYALLKSGKFNDAEKVFENNQMIDLEITNEIKNRDMDYYPHPFTNQDLTNKTVIMLDPTSKLIRTLGEMVEDGYDEIGGLINNKDILFGSTELNRKMPKGVIAVSSKWR